jgi:hypothetical protein
LPEAVQLNRSGVSGLSKPAQGSVTTIGTFNYFAGDDPTGVRAATVTGASSSQWPAPHREADRHEIRGREDVAGWKPMTNGQGLI